MNETEKETNKKLQLYSRAIKLKKYIICF